MSITSVIVFTTPQFAAREQDDINGMFASGLQTLHLRKPHWTAAELATYISGLSAEYHDRIVLHSCHELADKYQLKGIHYPEYARPPGRIEAIRGRTISTSLHSLSQLEVDFGALNYAFLSPIHDSISKQGHCSKFTAAELRQALPGSRQPMYALGGVDINNLQQTLCLGFAGVALLGSIWNTASPVEACQEALRQAQTVAECKPSSLLQNLLTNGPAQHKTK